jgi:hypothetical protein
MRLVKEYNNLSQMQGIVQVDKIPFESKEDGAKFVLACMANKKVGFTIIDYEWVLIGANDGSEIIANPTGGYIGKLPV